MFLAKFLKMTAIHNFRIPSLVFAMTFKPDYTFIYSKMLVNSTGV